MDDSSGSESDREVEEPPSKKAKVEPPVGYSRFRPLFPSPKLLIPNRKLLQVAVAAIVAVRDCQIGCMSGQPSIWTFGAG